MTNENIHLDEQLNNHAAQDAAAASFWENHPLTKRLATIAVIAGPTALAAACGESTAATPPSTSNSNVITTTNMSETTPSADNSGIDSENNKITITVTQQPTESQLSTPDPVESSSADAESFTLEPAPSAKELPESLQKYAINVKQAEANPDEYWDAYAKSIGMKFSPLSQEDAAAEQKLQYSNADGQNGVDLSQYFQESIGESTSNFANAYLANKNLPEDIKDKMISSLGKYFLTGAYAYEQNKDKYPFVDDLFKALDSMEEKGSTGAVRFQYEAVGLSSNGTGFKTTTPGGQIVAAEIFSEDSKWDGYLDVGTYAFSQDNNCLYIS